MKKHRTLLPITLLFLLLVSCNDTKKSNYSKQTNVEVKTTTYTASNHPGKKLMETKCYVCHNPSAKANTPADRGQEYALNTKKELKIIEKFKKLIANLYSKDKALGYNVNEVRGIWSITYVQ